MPLRLASSRPQSTGWLRLSSVLVGFFVAAATTLPAAPQPRGDLYVLSVGVDGHYPDSASDINAQDALYVRQALVAGESFYRHTHSRVLLGTAATRPAVQEGLNWLAASVGADDVAIVFFACHGNLERQGYFISLAQASAPQRGEADGIWGHELNAALANVKGQPILLIDSCHSGALLSAKAADHAAAMIVSCEARAVSVGQLERRDRPSGFFVIALCEALNGLADANHDRIVTLGEVGDYLPNRAQAFFEGQSAIVLRKPNAEAVPLARVNHAFTPQQILTPVRPRNPFRWPDVPDPDGADVHVFAQQATLDGSTSDPNAPAWPRTTVATTDRLDGVWASRWNNHKTPNEWVVGTAEVKCIGDRVYILFEQENGVKHLVDAVRVGSDRLAGRYVDPLKPRDTTPWAGRIVDPQRIDGQWGQGRWDLRRRFDPDQRLTSDLRDP